MKKIDSEAPLVSIVIVNWNGLQDTKLCLKHTAEQSYSNIEIVVVDNGSTDGSLEYLREYKTIKLVENHKNLGFSGGHIAGYKVSNGEYVLLLNNDAIMDSNYVKKAVKTMQADKSIGALGGRAYLWDEQNKLFDTTNEFYSYQTINPITAEGIFARSDEGAAQEVNNVSGSCVMVRRSTIDKVGYLHKPFFAYYEESDLFARMKRAGYKVVYHPKLAIWHANAKTANRKAPTFTYYMMMRNRFRFALRNFEPWYLRRFLKFYLKMGIVSAVKSLLPLKQRLMHRAYAKAFFYNLFFGWVPFIERTKLKRQLGPSNYSWLIVKEQINFSLVVYSDSLIDLQKSADISRLLPPGSELLVVVSKAELASRVSDYGRSAYPNLRFCIDRGYFDTHPENLGVVCSKNEWLVITPPVELENNRQNLLLQSQKRLGYLSAGRSIPKSVLAILKIPAAYMLIAHRTVLIDGGGLNKRLSRADALRSLMVYGFLSNSLLAIPSQYAGRQLAQYNGPIESHRLIAELRAKHNEIIADSKKPSALDRATARFYRLAQLRNLVTWLFSTNVSVRLKMARIKNLLLAVARSKRQALAIELKHIRNEVSRDRNFVDLVEMKRNEKQRLKYLMAHPEQTILFIIIRDRLTYLKQLIQWLEQQKLRRIVLVDNDSAFPPLTDYLARTEYQVLEMGRNTGHTGIWSSGIIRILLPDDFYVVSDPDIIPTASGKDTLSHLYRVQAKYPHHLKVGLGLKIDDLPDHYVLKKEVVKWESQFWKNPFEEGVFEAGVDTTFALYRPYTHKYFRHPALRTGEPFSARHLPWYANSSQLTDEDIFYQLRMDQSVNSWDKDHLPERYKKELAKQRH